MKRVILGLAGALVAVAALAGPVSANPADATVSVGPGVLYADTCQMHPYSYAVTLVPGESDWSIDTALIAPDGTNDGGAIVAESLGDPSTGTDAVQLCRGFDMPGTYRLRSTLEYFDSSFNLHDVQLPDQAFTMREPYSRTTVKLLKTLPGKHRVRVVAMDERPAGYFGIPYESVYLQRWTGSQWSRIAGAKALTNSTGVAVVTFRHNHAHRIKIRAVTVPTTDYAGSVSPAIRFR